MNGHEIFHLLYILFNLFEIYFIWPTINESKLTLMTTNQKLHAHIQTNLISVL